VVFTGNLCDHYVVSRDVASHENLPGGNMASLSRIAPEVPVDDLAGALDYYVQKLGFEIAMEMPGGDYAIVERDDVAIHLFQNDARPKIPVAVHIFTQDLDELHAELRERGATVSQDIETKPWGNRDFRVSDPSANEIKFTEPLDAEDE
jgi:uncharacterized glyoxalase superfamily protein PhnB